MPKGKKQHRGRDGERKENWEKEGSQWICRKEEPVRIYQHSS